MPEFVLPAVAVLAAFVAGVVLSTKVKDWLQGVPSELRSHLIDLEASIKAQVKAASARVVADVKAKVLPATPVLQTSVAVPNPGVGPVAPVAAPASVTAAVIAPHA